MAEGAVYRPMRRNRLRRSPEVWLRGGVRLLVVAVLTALLLLGIRDLIRPFFGAGITTRTQANPTNAYPREAAEAYAVRFAMAYLTFDSAHPNARQPALAPYLPVGGDPNVGWDGSGHQVAITAVPSVIDVRSAQQGLVTVAVMTDGGRWMYLAVSVVADPGGLVVSGEPALVPGPGRASWQPSIAAANSEDTDLSAKLRPSLAAFFRAYARSSQSELTYYAAPEIAFTGLGGAVELGDLSDLTVAQGQTDHRRAVATVRWFDRVSGAGLTQRYRLQLVRADGKWLVGAIAPEQ